MKTTAQDRLLQLIQILKDNNTIRYYSDMGQELGIAKQNFSKIRKKEVQFTVNQIQMIINKYHINPCWIFGLEENIFIK